MNLGKLQVDDARCGCGCDCECRSRLTSSFKRRTNCGFAHTHRQQTNTVASLLAQTALAIEVPPVVHHVGVHSMLPCHARHRCSWQHRQFHNPALLSNASPLPLAPFDFHHRCTVHHHLPHNH